MSNETLGFCVEYKAGKTSRAQYLTSDQKTVSPTGFVWSSEQAAKNAMGSFQAFVNRRHQPCASLKIVSPKVMQANAKKLVADAVKKAGEVESATKKENKGPTFPQTDDAKVSAEEHVEDAKPAEGPAQPIAISAENSSAVFHRLVDVTRAWSDMMAHADDDRALFARQMADEIVTSSGVHNKAAQKLHAYEERMLKHFDYYDTNSLISSSFDFLRLVIDNWFPIA